MNKSSPGRWRLRGWLLIFAVALGLWLSVCLIDTAWYVILTATKTKTPSFLAVFKFNLPYWIVAAFLTLPVVWLARRWPFAPGRRWRAAAIHLAGALLFSVLHELIFRAVSFPLIGKPMKTSEFFAAVRKFIAGSLDKEMLLYGVIVGTWLLGDTWQRYRERERAAAALELERARLEASLAAARLDALKAQIQPHFLFNALHAISTLVLKGDRQAADAMLSHLSRFLRMTLDSGNSAVVPLAVELEFLEAYLRIQQVRFGDRLRVLIDIPREIRDAEVPNLVLQPLVENAIQHGIDADPAAGTIRIRGAARAGRLTLEVEDDGAGLNGPAAPEERVGLGNIRARLEQIYPGDHAFTLRPADGRGTVARLDIPHRRAATGSAG